ncbi:hypothetical protein V8F20_010313 [Naviculisporaceae sp. PSN 640]
MSPRASKLGLLAIPLLLTSPVTGLAIFSATSASAQHPVIFHGTSVIISPGSGSGSKSSSHETPVSSSGSGPSLRAANFFCYMTEEAYFSFGWWVTPTLHRNDNETSHCRPDSSTYHWYEFASKISSTSSEVTFLTQNVAVRKPRAPNRGGHGARPIPYPEGKKVRYTIRPVDIGDHHGEGGLGQMAVSWIEADKDGDGIPDLGGQVWGVGTRKVLTPIPGTGEMMNVVEDCKKAVGTFRDIYERYDLREELSGMKVDWDVCEEEESDGKAGVSGGGGPGLVKQPPFGGGSGRGGINLDRELPGDL